MPEIIEKRGHKNRKANRYHPVNVNLILLPEICPNVTQRSLIINLIDRIREFERDKITVIYQRQIEALNETVTDLQAENARLKSQIELLTNRQAKKYEKEYTDIPQR